ncbi:hypothetical protein [uncultured Ruminococcus sp.]|uniref:hypothetical protein n=1 Tax=uncultured Ruminococcus sp. TaxID=165186 RepID=UPI0026170B8E|nr:hypothetical protein [uncultured Ruminococcus sp.]
MLTIYKEEYLGSDSGVSVMRAELFVDAKEDLPAPADLTGKILATASIAWEISSGDFWGLNSEGKWVNQATCEVYDPDPEEEEAAV